jgi:hypothetical protein
LTGLLFNAFNSVKAEKVVNLEPTPLEEPQKQA